MKAAWDFHHDRLAEQYNTILGKVQAKQREQRDRIQRFERLCQDGNVLVGINEMSADFLMGKLLIIEEDPAAIWKALENNFGTGYFNSVIERVMGVTTDFKDKLFLDFR